MNTKLGLLLILGLASSIEANTGLEKRDVSSSCKDLVNKIKGDDCFKFSAPTDVSYKTLQDTYGTYTSKQCSSDCDNKVKTYSQKLLETCVKGYGVDDANIARAVVSASFFARDIACTKGDDSSYCINSFLNRLEPVLNQINQKVKFDICGDKTTVIIQPFELSPIPKNFVCSNICMKKFIVGSYGWIKFLTDKLGQASLVRGYATEIKFLNLTSVSKWADDLNTVCSAPIVNKDYPIKYPANYGAKSPSKTTTAPVSTATIAPAPGTDYEGNKYYNNTPGYIPGDNLIGETADGQGLTISGSSGLTAGIVLVVAAGAGFLALL